ncbi:hypothetical protein JCM10207_006053 [Rhodosporidiobolus poonsookiae]
MAKSKDYSDSSDESSHASGSSAPKKQKRAKDESESSSEEEPMSKQVKKKKTKSSSPKEEKKGKDKDKKKKKKGKATEKVAPRKVGAARRGSLALEANQDGSKFVDLGDNRRITVKVWKEETKVDIREHYLKNGEMAPGNKGIALTVSQWDKIKKVVAMIDEAVDELEG